MISLVPVLARQRALVDGYRHVIGVLRPGLENALGFLAGGIQIVLPGCRRQGGGYQAGRADDVDTAKFAVKQFLHQRCGNVTIQGYQQDVAVISAQ